MSDDLYNFAFRVFSNNNLQLRDYKHPVLLKVPPCTERKLERTPEEIEHCLMSSRNRTINRIYDYARANEWEWFLTFTFDPQKVDSTDYSLVTKTLSGWIKNTKRSIAPDLAYLLVPELHNDGKKYHFHGILSNCGTMDFTYSGHDTKNGDKIYNLASFPFGFTTATRIKDTSRISGYICKYITKELCGTTKNKKRYWVSKNLKKPSTVKMFLSDEEKQIYIDGNFDNIGFIKTVNDCIIYELN